MNSKVLWITTGVIALAAMVATSAWFIVRPSPAPTGAATCHLAAPQAAAPTGTAASPEITVVEQGWSESRGVSSPRISIGVVLENTSDQVAYRTRVVFDALDSSDRTVIDDVQAEFRMIEVPILLPGAKVPVGNTLVGSDEARTARVTVTSSVSEWLPPGGADNGLTPISAQVVAGSGQLENDRAAEFSFTTRSDNCADLISRGVGFVWRDKAGKIVGGNIDWQKKSGACQAEESSRPTVAGSLMYTVPAEADLDKIELTVFCDLLPKSAGAGANRPIN